VVGGQHRLRVAAGEVDGAWVAGHHGAGARVDGPDGEGGRRARRGRGREVGDGQGGGAGRADADGDLAADGAGDRGHLRDRLVAGGAQGEGKGAVAQVVQAEGGVRGQDGIGVAAGEVDGAGVQPVSAPGGVGREGDLEGRAGDRAG